MDRCPRCGSARVYASRYRGVGERLHRVFTAKRPYRCHTCGWREWVEFEAVAPTHPDVDVQTLREARPDPPLAPGDLDRLDPAPPHDAGRQPHRRHRSADEIEAVDPDRVPD